MDNRFYDRVDDGDYNTWGNYDVENQYLLGDEQRLFLERLIHEYELNLIYSTDGEESLYINILTKIESDSTKKIFSGTSGDLVTFDLTIFNQVQLFSTYRGYWRLLMSHFFR